MIFKCNQAYYVHTLNSIGGIESHLWYLAKKYQDRDLCIVCSKGDRDQISRLRKYLRVIILDKNDRLECDTLFLTHNKTILNQCTARKKIMVLHANHKAYIESGLLKPSSIDHDDRIDEVIAVSNEAKRGWNDQDEVKVVYMPVELDIVNDPILLVSAMRSGSEKGIERMKALAKAMDDAGLNYLWQIYCNKPIDLQSSNVQLLPFRLDIANKLAIYDGLIQLSDHEAFCLVMQEALMRGVPVIMTDLPLLDDMKLKDSQVIRMPFDMKDIREQIIRIRNIKKMKAAMQKYEPPVDTWDEYITETKSDYKTREIKVRATDAYKKNGITDRELKFIPVRGYEWTVTIQRYEELIDLEKRTKTRFIELKFIPGG